MWVWRITWPPQQYHWMFLFFFLSLALIPFIPHFLALSLPHFCFPSLCISLPLSFSPPPPLSPLPSPLSLPLPFSLSLASYPDLCVFYSWGQLCCHTLYFSKQVSNACILSHCTCQVSSLETRRGFPISKLYWWETVCVANWNRLLRLISFILRT